MSVADQQKLQSLHAEHAQAVRYPDPETEACACGWDDCDHWAFSYPYCTGCGGHHRAPVSNAGCRCPVDIYGEIRDIEEPL